jgi:hypothetical protein
MRATYFCNFQSNCRKLTKIIGRNFAQSGHPDWLQDWALESNGCKAKRAGTRGPAVRSGPESSVGFSGTDAPSTNIVEKLPKTAIITTKLLALMSHLCINSRKISKLPKTAIVTTDLPAVMRHL